VRRRNIDGRTVQSYTFDAAVDQTTHQHFLIGRFLQTARSDYDPADELSMRSAAAP
jgi:hypothetical protein